MVEDIAEIPSANWNHVYTEQGFKDRREYLESLCDEYERQNVYALANLFGPTEDFDGLISALEDASGFD